MSLVLHLFLKKGFSHSYFVPIYVMSISSLDVLRISIQHWFSAIVFWGDFVWFLLCLSYLGFVIFLDYGLIICIKFGNFLAFIYWGIFFLPPSFWNSNYTSVETWNYPWVTKSLHIFKFFFLCVLQLNSFYFNDLTFLIFSYVVSSLVLSPFVKLYTSSIVIFFHPWKFHLIPFYIFNLFLIMLYVLLWTSYL